MSECYDWMEKLAENQETLRDESFLEHIERCPACYSLASALDGIWREATRLRETDLSDTEHDEILENIRKEISTQRSVPSPFGQKPAFPLRWKIIWAASLSSLIVLAGLMIQLLIPVKEEGVTQKAVPSESRRMKLMIQVDSKPRIYAFIEYTPESPDSNEKNERLKK